MDHVTQICPKSVFSLGLKLNQTGSSGQESVMSQEQWASFIRVFIKACKMISQEKTEVKISTGFKSSAEFLAEMQMECN